MDPNQADNTCFALSVQPRKCMNDGRQKAIGSLTIGDALKKYLLPHTEKDKLKTILNYKLSKLWLIWIFILYNNVIYGLKRKFSHKP
jgi:hypothetical protein